MALHDDLLRQAHTLARHEPKRPKQASLRRSVSSAYYALFHLLTSAASDRLITGSDRDALRSAIRRAFDHAVMKEACREIVKPNAGKLSKALDGRVVPPALVGVAEAFVDLQQTRHQADYDLTRTFTRREVMALIVQVERAFVDWQAVSKTVPADVFLAALLAYRGMCR